MNLNPQKIQQYKIHMNVSVAIRDQPTTIEESALISFCTNLTANAIFSLAIVDIPTADVYAENRL